MASTTHGPRSKLADVAVLSEDYFRVPEDAIPSLEAVLTLVGGHAVYASTEFASQME